MKIFDRIRAWNRNVYFFFLWLPDKLTAHRFNGYQAFAIIISCAILYGIVSLAGSLQE